MLSFSKSALCLLLASPLIAAVIAAGCSDTPSSGTTGGSAGMSQSSSSGETGGNGTSSGGGSGSASGGAGGNASGGSGNAGGSGSGTSSSSGMPVIVSCTAQVYQCGNTLDDDGDGLIDWQDPDCLGPCDNTEKGFNLGIPGGEGSDCIVDCYWDSNSGAGNDGCYWNHRCDPLSPEGTVECPHNPGANTPGTPLSCDTLLNQQPATCLSVCPQLVPNGCDCFGCCVLYKEGKEYGPVWLGTENPPGSKIYTCSLDVLGTPEQDANCNPCTQVKNECYNGCGTCELCIGKTPDDLPPECFPPPPPPDGGPLPDSGPDASPPPDAMPPPPQCPAGIQPCGLPGQDLCPVNYSCLTGCCIKNPT